MNTAFHPTPVRIDIDRFDCMGEAGIFPPKARIELIEGEMLAMAPMGSRHAYAVDSLFELFVRELSPAHAFVAAQNPVVLSRFSQPQPDLLLLAQPGRQYRDRRPRAADVLLLVEVADSTLAFDRRRKAPLYARAGIREIWIVDVQSPCLEVYRDPVAGQFTTRLDVPAADSIAPAFVPSMPLGWGRAVN